MEKSVKMEMTNTTDGGSNMLREDFNIKLLELKGLIITNIENTDSQTIYAELEHKSRNRLCVLTNEFPVLNFYPNYLQRVIFPSIQL